MPNHCCNTLILSKPIMPLFIRKYVKENEKGEDIFDFERIITVGNTQDWYKQRIKKWGTRSVGYDLNTGENIMDFFTAWTPPVFIIKKLAELHKKITFRLEYYELGMAFRGIAVAKWKKGKVLFEDHCWQITDKDLNDLGFSQSLNREKLE